jgi:hypothetical protein
VDDLEKRFGLKRVVFVGDRGMVTTDNITLLRQGGHSYLVGLNQRREEIYPIINKAVGFWQECLAKTGGGEEAPKTLVQEVAGEGTLGSAYLWFTPRNDWPMSKECERKPWNARG